MWHVTSPHSHWIGIRGPPRARNRVDDDTSWCGPRSAIQYYTLYYHELLGYRLQGDGHHGRDGAACGWWVGWPALRVPCL